MSKKRKDSGQLTLFQAASLANLFPPQEKETAGGMTVSSGLKCFELYERSGLLMLLVKTLLGSSVWNPGLYSAKYRLIWKAKATKSGDLYYQLSLSELPTKETGYGLLLTPGVVMHEEHPEDYKNRTVEKGYNRNNEWTSLAAQVKFMDLLPTPAAQEPGFKTENRNPVDKEGNPVKTHNHRWFDPETGRLMQKGLSHAIEILPPPKSQNANHPCSHGQGGMDLQIVVANLGLLGTPISRDWKDTGDMTNVPENGLLGRQVANIPTNGANTGMKLQPAFAEWMMGYPNGWTKPNTGQFIKPLSTSAQKKLDGKLDLIAQKSKTFYSGLVGSKF